MEPIVKPENITKEYQAGTGTVKVVKDISLEIQEQEFIIMPSIWFYDRIFQCSVDSFFP